MPEPDTTADPAAAPADWQAAIASEQVARTASQRRTGARMIALGLAMRSKIREPDEKTLGLAVIAVGEALDPADPLAVAMKDFAAAWPQLRFGGAPLVEAGEVLFQAVVRSTWPMPHPSEVAG